MERTRCYRARGPRVCPIALRNPALPTTIYFAIIAHDVNICPLLRFRGAGGGASALPPKRTITPKPSIFLTLKFFRENEIFSANRRENQLKIPPLLTIRIFILLYSMLYSNPPIVAKIFYEILERDISREGIASELIKRGFEERRRRKRCNGVSVRRMSTSSVTTTTRAWEGV